MSLARILRILSITSTLLNRELPRGDDEAESPERAEWNHFNERCASDSLKTLTAAEADFRANDRDWCTVNDFWSGEVRGLYTLSSASAPVEGQDSAVRLIELSVASADEDPETPD